MLGTARLLGQTSGAALVALMFNMFSTNGTRLLDTGWLFCQYRGTGESLTCNTKSH